MNAEETDYTPRAVMDEERREAARKRLAARQERMQAREEAGLPPVSPRTEWAPLIEGLKPEREPASEPEPDRMPEQDTAPAATETQIREEPAAQPKAGAESPAPAEKRSRYVASIDGLRAFAVLAVIFYHMHLDWAPGGLMGVTVFFVISGYLINGLLVNERETTGRIDLPAFWLRRIRRLFPAIVLAVVGTAALCTVLNQGLLDKMCPDIVPSLFFFNNWWQIFHEVSYFEAAGAPSPLTHFWSLSIEEQFYVVWPLLLLALFALPGAKKDTGRRHRAMQVFVLVLAVVSALEMAFLYDPQGDPSRVYYGTDTRAMSLLIGAWLAFAWPSAAFDGQQRQVSGGNRTLANLIGTVALADLVVVMVFTSGFSMFPYYGGIVLTSIFTAALIGTLVIPGTWMDRLLSLKPLVWIGKRSYGMYLWHFPILLLTVDSTSTLEVPVWVYFVQMALIFVISDLSYRFVENPIRQYGFVNWLRGRTDGTRRDIPGADALPTGPSHGKRPPLRTAAPAFCSAALLALAIAGVAGMQLPTATAGYSLPQIAAAIDATPRQQEAATEEEPDKAETAKDAEPAARDEDAGGDAGTADQDGKSDEKDETASQDGEAAQVLDTPEFNEAGQPLYEPLLIGDSVAASAIDQFPDVFPNGHIDAVVNRNVWESPYADYAASDQVGTYVVFCLGTNNAVVDWQVDDEMLAGVGEDKKVFLVNTRSPREWVDATNQVLADAVGRHANVVKLIDWYGYSAGHDEWFYEDGTHLNEQGARAYLDLIRSEIENS